MRADIIPEGIPAHVAAYAAALHDMGAGNWGDVRDLIARAGMGSYDFRVLARVACAWARENVAASVRSTLRRRALAERRARPVAVGANALGTADWPLKTGPKDGTWQGCGRKLAFGGYRCGDETADKVALCDDCIPAEPARRGRP